MYTLAPNGCFGIAVPWGNITTQIEIENIRPNGTCNTIAHFDLGKSWPEHVTAAARHLGAFDPVAVMLSLHPELTGNVHRLDAVAEAVSQSTAAPTIVAPHAVVEAIRAIGATRIALITPGFDEQTANATEFYRSCGIDVVNAIGLERGLGNIGNTPVELVRNAIREADDDRAGAVVQIGSNLPALGMAEELAERLGKPVVTANAALYWSGLRRAGFDDPVPCLPPVETD
jgi:maleate isomerase